MSRVLRLHAAQQVPQHPLDARLRTARHRATVVARDVREHRRQRVYRQVHDLQAREGQQRQHQLLQLLVERRLAGRPGGQQRALEDAEVHEGSA